MKPQPFRDGRTGGVSTLEYFLVGILAGLTLGALGTAWGAITVPFLLVLGVDPMSAKGSALLSELTATGTGIAYHKRERNVHTGLSSSLLVGIVGALIGAYLSKGLSTHSFRFLIGIYEVFAGVILIFGRRGNRINVERNEGLFLAAIIGFLAGFVKGFLGTGWGPIGVSLLMLLGAAPKKVVGSSLVARLAISGSAAAFYVLGGYVYVGVLVPLMVGGVVGTLAGGLVSKASDEKVMKRSLGVLLTILGAWILMRV